MKNKLIILFCFILTYFFIFKSVLAGSDSISSENTHGPVYTLLWMGVILIFALIGRLIEKLGQPSVLGELMIGVVLGNLTLIGINIFEPIKSDIFIKFLSELGVIILLFQVGLESNIEKMKKVGSRALIVAIVGVIAPFVLGTWIVGPFLMPGLSQNTYLFLGAALTATSVGITARVFKDLGKLQMKEAQIILGAAVIDDVIGLIILAVVSAIATIGLISVGTVSLITIKATLFLILAILLGRILTPYISNIFSKISTGIGAKFTMAIVFGLFYSAVAGMIGLAPIVGAFAAGLILDPVHFKTFKKSKASSEMEKEAELLLEENKKRLKEKADIHNDHHIEELIEPVGHFLVPIFFVFTGISVKLETLFNPKILLVALAVTLVAFIGKYISGFFAGNVNKKIVGFGMVPRGEVGLIFATIGMSLGVLNNEIFSIIVIMVILTTLLTPPILSHFIKKQRE